ncbi:manganese/zinc/iron transport system substrate-binding protein [Anaerosphaera aminiphila DSM 21120]|uniref:Manganese/zinc/iron transport system substrate-binding protein n=1 Tax=Anaerosphaera aminiphila DSM 21120 TaxID=1120995 RepID=A0A1M5TI00_9FIRM|nr:zinc ABC transporter substrate-binding protein [Anaerosphaera aminiphila]SHH50308.1 manganese/zinc/iron transport system substrate-binding protein [Anaerosphaera aminiphila DSM 21120]
MKKIITILTVLLTLVGCQSSETKNTSTTDKHLDKKVVTVTTSFLNDMVNELAGDIVDREVVIPAGESPHLYVAKPKDLQKIYDGDLVLYQGLGFEGNLTEALEQEGYCVTENFSKDDVKTIDDEGNEIIDPHFWFNIDFYKLATENVSKKLVELVPEQRETIEKNTENYISQLTKLDEENRNLLSQIPEDSKYLITPHDAFNYFSEWYNIPVKAPQGMGSDTEVANKDIQKTVDFIIDHKIKAVFAESTTDPARMEKLQEDCKSRGFEVKVVSGKNQELFSDSLAPKGEIGDTFIGMYKHNVELITENLK